MRAVHHAFVPRCEVHVSEYRAPAGDEAEFPSCGGHFGVVGLDVRVRVEVRGELGREAVLKSEVSFGGVDGRACGAGGVEMCSREPNWRVDGGGIGERGEGVRVE